MLNLRPCLSANGICVIKIHQNKANYGALEALWGSWKKRRQIAALGFNNSALTSSTSIHRSVCNQITAMIVAQKPALSNLSNGPFFAQSSSEMSR